MREATDYCSLRDVLVVASRPSSSSSSSSSSLFTYTAYQGLRILWVYEAAVGGGSSSSSSSSKG